MKPDNHANISLTNEEALQKIAGLEDKLLDARNLIYAIRHGEVDALLMNKNGKADVYSLENIDYTYRVLVEKIGEGALSISKEGLILYCNSYFSDLINIPLSKIVGSYLWSYFSNVETYNTLLSSTTEGIFKGEINLVVEGKVIPVYISITSLEPNLPGFGIILNDQTAKKKSEEAILAQQKQLEENIKELRHREKQLSRANEELVFQSKEKEKIAAELTIANKELAIQNKEKEKREAELIIANKELAFQNEEKEKRAAELIIANKELLAFTYVSSHDLQEPLRKIQTFAAMILEEESRNLSDNGKYNFQRMQLTAGRMQQLIDDLLAFSRISTSELKFEKTDLNLIIEDVKTELKDTIQEKRATIETPELCPVNIIPFQFRQLMYNLISNALKFSNSEIPSHIIIKCEIVKGSESNNEKLSHRKNYYHITIKDNGIGFEPHFNERIFGVFQKLHSKEVYAGTGIGLAIVKKIVENHNGIITAKSEVMKGAMFDIYIPATSSK